MRVSFSHPITASVHDNVTVFTVPDAVENLGIYNMTWYGSSGTVIKRFKSSLRSTTSVPGTAPQRALGPHGIGAVDFGLPKAKAVADLRARFGPPTTQGVNPGCGPRFTEVEWDDLAAEFDSGTFSGYRYITGGLALTSHHKVSNAVAPKLATATRISLGSTVRQLRAAYKTLHLAGAETWQASDGLTFVSNAKRSPPPASSRLIEIKIGTCGDY